MTWWARALLLCVAMKDDQLNQASLADAYVRLIGYNPYEDNPSITDAEVYQTLCEYVAEARANGNAIRDNWLEVNQ